MQLHAAVAQTLRDLKVDILFGLMGDANMAYMANWEQAGGETVHAVAEGGAVGMADGYARTSDRVAVVTVTHGPGLTNSLTALTEAVKAGSKVLVLTGDTAAKPHERQYLDVRAAAALTGASYRKVMRAQDVVNDISAATAHVVTTRTPLVLDIPSDLMTQEVDYIAPSALVESRQRTMPDPEALDNALGIIASANRPIVLAGRGAVSAGCHDALVELAELVGAPLATTLLAREWFADQDFNLGIFGTLSDEIAADAISQADCIVAFGASLNRDTTMNNDFLKGKRVVQCDVEPRHLGRYRAVDAAVAGDAGAIAEVMITELRAAELGASSFRSERLRMALADRRPAVYDDRSPAGTVDIRSACQALAGQLPPDRLVVTDAGRFRSVAWDYLTVTDPTDFIHTVNFGSIGLGTAVALGASFAKRDRVTVSVTGDAGGAMAMHEFVIAVRHELPFVFLMFNDGAYGAEYRRLPDYGIDPKYSQISWPEFAEVGRSLGGHGITVRSLEDLTEAARLIEARTFPLWIDVKVDPGIDIPRSAW